SITRHSKSVRSYWLMHMLNQISRAPPILFMSSRPRHIWERRADRPLLGLSPRRGAGTVNATVMMTGKGARKGTETGDSEVLPFRGPHHTDPEPSPHRPDRCRP